MRKRISLKTRRPGLTLEAFRDHYESRHVPLGLAHVDRFQWRRYVRNYVVEALGIPVAFDGYAEFWVDDDADDEALARFVASPEFAALHEDDARFLDVGARFSAEVVAVPFEAAAGRTREAGAAKTDDAEKVVMLWTAGAGVAGESAACAARITASLADRVVAATLEQVLDPAPTAPFDTLLTMFLAEARAADIPLGAMPGSPWSLLTLDPVETPADRLFGGAPTAVAPAPPCAPESERTKEWSP